MRSFSYIMDGRTVSGKVILFECTAQEGCTWKGGGRGHLSSSQISQINAGDQWGDVSLLDYPCTHLI